MKERETSTSGVTFTPLSSASVFTSHWWGWCSLSDRRPVAPAQPLRKDGWFTTATRTHWYENKSPPPPPPRVLLVHPQNSLHQNKAPLRHQSFSSAWELFFGQQFRPWLLSVCLYGFYRFLFILCLSVCVWVCLCRSLYWKQVEKIDDVAEVSRNTKTLRKCVVN